MEIIKKGKIEHKKHKFTCGYCGTIFIADETEYKNADQMEYMHDGIIAKCECPICGKWCIFNKE